MHSYDGALDGVVNALLAACLAVQVGILVTLGSRVGRDLLLLQVSCFTPDQFSAIVGAWTPAQRLAFERHFYLDLWYPFLYGSLLWLRSRSLAPPGSRARDALACLALLGAALDVAENALHILSYRGLSTRHVRAWAVQGAAIAAISKWAITLPLCVILRPGQVPWPRYAKL